MTQDLLALSDHEPPMGDLFTDARLDTGRAVWTGRLPGEREMAKKRIVHQRVVRLHGEAKLLRLGLRRGQGYHKCGSRQDLDWVTSLRVLGWTGGRWREVWRGDDLRAPAVGAVRWIKLPQMTVSGVILEVRRSGIDDGWTPWNLAMSAFVLEGELLVPIAPRQERLLTLESVELSGLPRGVTAEVRDGSVRYRTREFEVGFAVGRPGFSFFGLHVEDDANAGINLLTTRPPLFHQGPQLHPLGAPPLIAPAVRCDLEGAVRVKGATVRYAFSTGGQHYTLTWRVSSQGLELRAERSAERALFAWHSAAWQIGLRNSASPSQVLGRLLMDGESGAVALPALLTLPAFGSWDIRSSSPAGWARSDCRRSQDVNTLELKVGEERTPEGMYRLPAGTHRAIFTLTPHRPGALLHASAPAVAKRAVARTRWTALTFRSDTATLSNNGASMHCPICMDTWSAIAPGLGEVFPGLPATEFLRLSLERWLTGGPGYAAGRLLQGGRAHDADDEYLMTGASALLGLGNFLRQTATRGWFREYRPWITAKLRAAEQRDLDGDGLIESAYRTGVSGTSQWSTCWFDVISFGWKDAFANAILYGALGALEGGLERCDEKAEARTLRAWAERLKLNYRAAFWNEQTGWLAGWRCRAGKLHDYAFLPINGAAVAVGLIEGAEARVMLRRLLTEAARVRMPDAALGMPGNLWPIPDFDLADIMQGYPLGYYQNGGRTHSQTRHLIMGLYRCGLTREADRLLKRLCVGFADARVFGGNQSGVDWRYWDDRPCGYEGLLTDQFGVLEPILWRWGAQASRS
ncbi:hypothetical protein [Opitutus terrae]|uniref:Alpha-L-rhamnosidase six-hairpin glycosidase domain-containing protein n=1 Tax=Opitutus terrae (strain DSM 11246 / JCM 15787 / PB90-1) TaxID=452637 RepID=B1ZY47_OPITP|nr:hypothetical protein [Opitutus terrae]ACB76196.1 hypothetical protein Oter_2915 [Opitutus terrae PB90-1]